MLTKSTDQTPAATDSRTRLRTLVTLAMLAALAYVVMLIGRLPIAPVPFLKYDPKDIVIVIGGFLYGPLAAAAVSLVVSLVEMITASDTGFIGLAMNLLSTCSFACVAALLYRRKRTLAGAVAGLVCGVAAMAAVMLLWNYFITPLYMGATRQEVAALLLPVFLPFNLLKGGINAVAALLLYKPVVSALRAARLVPPSQGRPVGWRRYAGTLLAGLVLLATLVLGVLVFKGVL